MIITTDAVQHLRDLGFPVDLVLVGPDPTPAAPRPTPGVVVHHPGCPEAREPRQFKPVAGRYVLCTTCENPHTSKAPFAVLHAAHRQATVIAQHTGDITRELQRSRTLERSFTAALLVMAAERALAHIPKELASRTGRYTLPLEAFITSLTTLVNAARDDYRTWLTASFTSFDPNSPDRYLLLRDGSQDSRLHCFPAAAAYETIAHAGLWTVIQAPDLTGTAEFERDAFHCLVADLGPVGEGIPPAAWAAFTACSPHADPTLAAQYNIVTALRTACAA